MGGLACCGNSTERKEDTLQFPMHKPMSASPGKNTVESDNLWEITDEMKNPHEKDIKFVKYINDNWLLQTKTGMVHLFETLSTLDTFKVHLNTEKVKLWVSEVY